MKVGLCVVVRNEERTISACLDSARDICEDIVVVDTGSTDNTRQVLEQRYGIAPIVRLPAHADFPCLAAARNIGFDRVRSNWILILDADEQLSPRAVECIGALPEAGPEAGYFLPWNTYREDSVIEDYKLALFRKGFQSRGLIHENMQYAIREAGQQAGWLDGAEIIHRPEPEKDALRSGRPARLVRAIAENPGWHRYHWFLGYHLLRMGDVSGAIGHLETAARSRSRCFPVECLNSMLLLAEIRAQCGDRDAVRRELQSACEFLAEVATDFEVRINHRLPGWLENAKALEAEGRLHAIRAYHFAH